MSEIIIIDFLFIWHLLTPNDHAKIIFFNSVYLVKKWLPGKYYNKQWICTDIIIHTAIFLRIDNYRQKSTADIFIVPLFNEP